MFYSGAYHVDKEIVVPCGAFDFSAAAHAPRQSSNRCAAPGWHITGSVRERHNEQHGRDRSAAVTGTARPFRGIVAIGCGGPISADPGGFRSDEGEHGNLVASGKGQP